MKIDYFLPTIGIAVNPVNRRDIYLEVNHDQGAVINQPAPHVGINNLYFAREEVKMIMDYVAQHGLTEGIPFEVRMRERSQTYTIPMYLDLMQGFIRSNDGLKPSVKMLESLDWLDDKVDGFTFESMYNETGVQAFTVDNIA
jgi:hypothetical protein